MSKFKVGDLITDICGLYLILAVSDTKYSLKTIVSPLRVDQQGKIFENKITIVDSLGVIYDLNSPLIKDVNAGVCHCEYCNRIKSASTIDEFRNSIRHCGNVHRKRKKPAMYDSDQIAIKYGLTTEDHEITFYFEKESQPMMDQKEPSLCEIKTAN